MIYFSIFTYGKMSSVVQSLFSSQSFQEMAFAADISAAVLEQTHRHGNLFKVNEQNDEK